MELNSQNSSSRRMRNGRKLIRTLTSTLSCVTLVVNSTPPPVDCPSAPMPETREKTSSEAPIG
jgi:hypothetical protein